MTQTTSLDAPKMTSEFSTEETETERSELELAVVKAMRENGARPMNAAILASEMDVEERKEYLFQDAQETTPLNPLQRFPHPANPLSGLIEERGMFAPADYAGVSTNHAWVQKHTPRAAKVGLLTAGAMMIAMPTAGMLADAFTPQLHAAVPDLPDLYDVDFVVPAAHATGAGGSFWTTNLKAAALGVEPASYRIIAVRNNHLFTDAVAMSAVRTVAPGSSEHLVDVVYSELGLDTFSGTLFLDVVAGQLDFDSRTLNSIDGSVVGQRIKPAAFQERMGKGTTGVLFVEPEWQTYRTNTWFVAWEDTHIVYAIRDDRASEVKEGAFDLEQGQARQFNDFVGVIERGAGIGPLAIMFTSTGTVSAGNSVIDNRGAQDPTWLPLNVDYLYEGDTVAAAAAGANGSQWQTDVTIANPSPVGHGVNVVVRGKYWASTGGVGQTQQLVYSDGCWKFINVVADAFSLPGTAGTMQLSSVDAVRATARIYSVNADGSTSGQGVPFFPRDAALQEGQTALLHGLEETLDARTNVGALNPSETASATLKFVVSEGDTGIVLGSFQKTLGPKEWYQKNQLLERYGYTGINGMVNITVLDGEAHAYASTVANEPALPEEQRHNDPSFQSAVLVPFCDDACQYVREYFPSRTTSSIFLDNFEIRSAILGTHGVQNYALPIGRIFSRGNRPYSAEWWVERLVELADGEFPISNPYDDFDSTVDPFRWQPDNIRMFRERAGIGLPVVTDIVLRNQDALSLRLLLRDVILPDIVRNNPDRYTSPATWNVSNPNP